MLFFSSRRRHTRWPRDWSSDVCSSDLSTDVGLSITFTCGVSDGTPPYTFLWTFGDDATGSESTMAHAYTSSGPKTATCTITEIGRASCRERAEIAVRQ